MAWDGKLTQLDVARILSCGGSLRSLANHERRLFFLLADGLTTRLAAGRMGIKVNTARTLCSTIQRRLGLHSIQELRAFAKENGLTDSPPA